MEKLPETLYVDPTEGSYSSAKAKCAEHARIEQAIQLLYQPSRREEALAMLNKERESKDMPLLLWNAMSVSFILIQEISKAYGLISPPVLDLKVVTNVCNALALVQSLATHPDTKLKIVRAKLPTYFFPYLNTTTKGNKYFDYLRVTSLGVIGTLVKVEDINTPEIIHYLLESEVFPLCLCCIEVGSELVQTVAAFVVSKILLHEEGQRYCGTFPERFYALSQVLTSTIDQFRGKPSSQLLKHVLTCFMRLSEMSRCCDALTKRYPLKLRDPEYLNFACDDAIVRRFADQVLQKVTDPMMVDPTSTRMFS